MINHKENSNILARQESVSNKIVAPEDRIASDPTSWGSSVMNYVHVAVVKNINNVGRIR